MKTPFPILETLFRSPSAFFRGALLLAGALCTGQVHAAGPAAATSTYMTIQPNGAGTAYVITMSWVAPDSNASGDGSTYANLPAQGNGTAALDNPSNLQGGDLLTGAGQAIRYRWTAAAVSSGSHVRYDTAPANTASIVQWASSGDYDVATVNPTAATVQWLNLGQWHSGDTWTTNVQAYGSDGGGMSTGVTGVFSTNPNGTGAATGDGVGVYYDYASPTTGGMGFMLSGYDDLQDPTPNNPYPTRGYVRVEIPNPTTKWNNPAGGDFTVVPYTFNFADKFNTGTFTANGSVELVVTTDAGYSPKIALSGDLDSDLDVDAADLALAAAGFGGANVATKWYADGNMDADTDSDNADLGFVIGAFTPSSSSGSANLTYDPATGNVKLDATTAAGAKITSFQIESAAATIVPGSYTGPAFGGTKQDVTTSVIGNTDTSLTGATGQVDLGNVFPTGMDLAGLQAYLTTAVYTGASGTGQQQLTPVLAASGSTYATWSGGPAANVDTNADGVDNGVAWALGAADTAENAIGLLPTVDDTDPVFFIFSFNRSNDAEADTSTTITVEYGSDLSGWTPAEAGTDIVITEGTPGTTTTPVEVKIRRTLAVDGKLFVRLNVVVVE